MLSFYSRILVAYDGSDLSKKALEMAITLAKQDNRVEVDVVNVVTPYVVPMNTSAIYYEEIRNIIHQDAEKLMVDAKQKLESIPNKTRTFVLEGNPGQMIIDFSKKNDCDLIVMGSRGLTGLKEFFIGSVSHYVVQHAHCPVLIVK